jgi:diguanylate cyclase (GGDEF)-like protein/PAS domain S-box-containing protein
MALSDAATGRFLQVNDALLAPTGYGRSELLSMCQSDISPPSGSTQTQRQLQPPQTASSPPAPAEIEYVRKDGTTFPALRSGIAMKDASGRDVVWSIVQDISQRKSMEKALADAARTDKLTGLANRALFMERLERMVKRQRQNKGGGFAVLFLDFDRFKLINDTLGHKAGDELLCQVALRLQSALRALDTHNIDARDNLVSRFGGDEFLILINGIRNPADATIFAERILKSLSPGYSIFNSEVHSLASVGIVTSEQCSGSAEELVRNADLAMYEAKRAGRGCVVVFNDAMHIRLTRHVAIESGLRRAIGTSELSLVYQPIVDLQTGYRVSVEALARWEHPTLGTISPIEFIPIAEESGLIVRLGQWVLQGACETLAAWRSVDPANAPATVSVNISRAEIAMGKGLLEQVTSTLERTGLPASSLQLEVTEREVMRNPAAALVLLNELHELGVKLAMDDFGTGTSSLSLLREYPFDTIKIDRSFVQDLTSNRDVLAVIHATIGLIENLGMCSLAEGVEQFEQVAVLQSLGCRFAQGYFFSKPVTAAQAFESVARIEHRQRMAAS